MVYMSLREKLSQIPLQIYRDLQCESINRQVMFQLCQLTNRGGQNVKKHNYSHDQYMYTYFLQYKQILEILQPLYSNNKHEKSPYLLIGGPQRRKQLRMDSQQHQSLYLQAILLLQIRMEVSCKLNTSHQHHQHRLNRKQKSNHQQKLHNRMRVFSKLQLQTMGQYIGRNVHSNRKNIMHLYENGVEQKRKRKSFSLPLLGRQPDQLSLIQKHLQTQEFKRYYIQNYQNKKDAKNLSDSQTVIVRSFIEAYSPSSKKNKKSNRQLLKKKEPGSVQRVTCRTLERSRLEINPQFSSIRSRKRLINLQDKLGLRQISELKPWQHLMKGQKTSQNSNIFS